MEYVQRFLNEAESNERLRRTVTGIEPMIGTFEIHHVNRISFAQVFILPSPTTEKQSNLELFPLLPVGRDKFLAFGHEIRGFEFTYSRWTSLL